jgi:CDP-diglyceride synthetase
VTYWYYFWLVNFAVAGSAFVIITLVVVVRGIGDLREMFLRLRQHKDKDSDK